MLDAPTVGVRRRTAARRGAGDEPKTAEIEGGGNAEEKRKQGPTTGANTETVATCAVLGERRGPPDGSDRVRAP